VLGVDRSYDLFVPTPYKATTPHALIFSYHGVGGTANTNQFKLDTFSKAKDGFSINVAPQGWPTAAWPENHFVDYPDLSAHLEMFDQLVDSIAAKYCVDLNRVFVIGHSNGGQMAFHLGCLRGDRIRAVFPMGGRCFIVGPGVCDPYNKPSTQKCVGQVVVMSVMGQDDVERLADEEATVAGFRDRQGCTSGSMAVDPSPCVRYDGCDPGGEVTSCRIPGLAHAVWKDGLADIYGVMVSQ
jgi:polyhydroxybutyrate depolymerase